MPELREQIIALIRDHEANRRRLGEPDHPCRGDVERLRDEVKRLSGEVAELRATAHSHEPTAPEREA